MEQDPQDARRHSRQLSGNAADFQSFLGRELWVVLTALFAVYVALGILYESYVHPVAIISTLPSAGELARWIVQLWKCVLQLAVNPW